METDELVRGVLAGDERALGVIVERAESSTDPRVLVAAALVVPAGQRLLARAAASSATARDRQAVAVAAACVSGDRDRALLLARDHLADHPDDLLVAHIASVCTAPARTDAERPSS